MPGPTLPPLRHISLSSVSSLPGPGAKIHTDADITTWRTTRGYTDYALFLKRINESVVGYMLPWTSSRQSEAVTKLLEMLDTLNTWIDEIPPLESPQRFGNLAFRTWGKRLEDNVDTLLTTLLPPPMPPLLIPYLKPYFLTSFGSFTRMDYGTGHETSFFLFLCCLALVRFLPLPISSPSSYPPQSFAFPTTESDDLELERTVALTLFPSYLCLTWRLQDVYRLEPAGSHGVWGLDDYSFLGYLFGSAQMKGQDQIPPSSILQTPLPPTTLYNLLITRIHALKTGPFYEHSSQLYSIATGVERWEKVNSGLGKMYEAEVLGKRVVVQHIPLGGLLEWDPPSQSPSASPSPSSVNTSTPTPVTHTYAQTGTQAPWLLSSSTPSGLGLSSVSTQAPWASPTALAPSSIRPASATRMGFSPSAGLVGTSRIPGNTGGGSSQLQLPTRRLMVPPSHTPPPPPPS